MNADRHADIVSTVILMDRPFYEAESDFDLSAAFEVQDLVAERLAPPRGGLAGYKIAWNAPHLMEAFAMPHPGMGRVFASQVHRDRAEVRLSDFRGLFIEAEIAATLSADLAPGRVHDAQSVAGAVAGFSAAFEILDKFGAPATARAPDILAHNVFNAGAVIASASVPAAGFDSKRVTTRIRDGQRVVAEGAGLAPQDPFEAIAFLANHFTARGHTMRAGEFVLCGSHIPLYPVEAPTRLGISMGPLGEVWLTVSATE